ncbi:MAG: response regulator [Kofleriaceae bacterium]
MSRDHVQILLVEDSRSDAELTVDALRSAKVVNHVHCVSDGVEALEYLRDPNRGPRPELIVLDLNMPRMNGFEFLEVVKADPELFKIPIIVLTTSDAERDILRTYRERANCYISKPVDLPEFMAVVQQIGDFWLQIVKLPPSDGVPPR